MLRKRGLFPGLCGQWRTGTVMILCAGLASCAQSGGILTGALGPSSAPTAASTSGPPLPERRSAQNSEERRGSSAGLLAALPDIDLSVPTVAPSSVVTQESPINVYVRVARQIRRCWLGPDNPKLPGYGFRASAQPGDAGEAEIDIYKEVEGRKYGPFAFEVKITPEGSGALVRSRNRSLDDELADTLRGDVARWTNGASECAAPKVQNS